MNTFDRPSRVRRAIVGGAALAALSFTTRRAHAQDTSFTVMTVGGTWGDAIRTIIGEPFAARHGLTLSFDNRPNAQQLAVLQASRGRPTIDTIELGGPRLGQATAMGLLARLDPAVVKNLARVFPALRNDYWAARSIAPWALAFDTRVFNREEAQQLGWALLQDPRAKGRVALPNFGWMGEMWLNSVNQAMGGSYQNLDPGFAFAAKVMKSNGGSIMISNDQGMKLFGTGEIVAAPFWSGRTLELQRKGVPLDVVYPKGWSPYGFGFSVVAQGSKMELAQQFVEASLSDEAQLKFARQFSYVPTLQDIKVPDDMPDSRIAPALFEIAANLDYSEVAKYSDKSLERWNMEIAS
jgi:putative spermidine/putrescine transport system substrate-binding protein